MQKTPKTKLKSKSSVIFPDGTVVPYSSLTKAQKKELAKQMNERLAMEMSGYYTQHEQAYIELQKIAKASRRK